MVVLKSLILHSLSAVKQNVQQMWNIKIYWGGKTWAIQLYSHDEILGISSVQTTWPYVIADLHYLWESHYEAHQRRSEGNVTAQHSSQLLCEYISSASFFKVMLLLLGHTTSPQQCYKPVTSFIRRACMLNISAMMLLSGNINVLVKRRRPTVSKP